MDGPGHATRSWGPVRTGLAGLVPWATFHIAVTVTVEFIDYKSVDLAGMLRASPFYLVILAGFSVLPIVVARTDLAKLAATVAMGVVAAGAGVVAAATDDAQAGLAVLWVPLVAIVLALAMAVAQAIGLHRGRRRATGLGN
jgi:hypothetical protein